jgi:transposase
MGKKHKRQPHRGEFFPCSTDPELARDVRDMVGLYLNPPDQAIVFRVDEKSPMQVRERTPPLLPLRPGWPARPTHEEERHGGTPRFTALNVLEGRGIAAGPPRPRHQEFLRFLNRIDESVDSGRPIHLVLDDSGRHQHPTVKKWLAVRPRYPVHFTPTSSSWLNPIERWFAAITRKRIRRGTLRSVGDLTRAIQESIQRSNRNRQPFQWVASARKIIRKVNKYKETLETGD